MAATAPALIYPRADLSLAALQPFTIGATGALTMISTAPWNGTGGASMLGYIDSISLEISQQLLEAISVDAAFMNRLATIIDGGFTVIENMKRSSATTDGPYGPLIAAYPGAVLTFAYQGIGSHVDKYTIYGLWENIRTGVQGIGAQKVATSFRLFDTSYLASGVNPITVARV